MRRNSHQLVEYKQLIYLRERQETQQGVHLKDRKGGRGWEKKDRGSDKKDMGQSYGKSN